MNKLTASEHALVALAAEYGYKGCEKGWNLENTIIELFKLFEEKESNEKH